MSKVNTHCEDRTVIDDESTQRRLWEIYESAFQKAKTESIQDQLCYTREAFMAALVDPVYRKFVVYVDAQAVGYTLTTLDLERARVTYLNPTRLIQEYPDHTGRICYFTSIAIDPLHQGSPAIRTLLLTVAEVIEREDLVMAFDFSTETRSELPKFFLAVLRDAQKKFGWGPNEFEYRSLGGQTYGAIEIKRP